jgi:glycogen synthase
MEIVHVSAECYPVAKAGGLGDVVGALPKYQCNAGDVAKELNSYTSMNGALNLKEIPI